MITNEESKLIFPSDLFWLFYNEYLGNDLMYEYALKFNTKNCRVPDEKLSYRTINHWCQNDLIADNRPAGKGWRKFSKSEVTWILIMRELRKMGLSLEKIKKTKEALSKYKDLKGVSEMPYLDFFSMYGFYTQTPVSLYVFNDGDAVICNPSTMLLNKQLTTIPNYIEIDLNNLIQEVFPFKKLIPKHGNLIYCSDQELGILDELKRTGMHSLKITLKDGLPVTLERFSKKPLEKGFKLPVAYGEFTGIVHQGKVMSYTITEKVKI